MKRHSGTYAFNGALMILIYLLAQACQSNEQPWLEKALEAEAYLQTASIDQTNGMAWKIMPDSASGADVSLYSGTPGIVLFYLELYNSTHDTAHLAQARAGADFLLASLPDTLPSAFEVGLYTGIAGIGYTLTETYKATGNETYRQGLDKALNLLYESATPTTDGYHWGEITDIVYGAAGIGLFLQYVSDELNIARADSTATLVALELLKQATNEDGAMRWRMQPGMDIHMDNFSHGTAGVAYFLAQTYERSRVPELKEAALSAGNWLATNTNEQGFVSHHLPGGEDLYYQSWCHGPAGTSRLYYSLFKLTGEKKWMDLIEKGAAGTLSLGLVENKTPGFWNNVGRCCGDVGVAEHYLWLHEITGKQEYLDFALAMTEKALSLGTSTENGLKWVHAENRRSPEQVAAQTGLMQGSAGMGLWFLRLNTYLEGKTALLNFPDQPKVK